MALSFAYLGPRGTFAEAAINALGFASDAIHVPAESVPAALELVRAGKVDGALVPIENSVEGGVPTTLDGLAHGQQLEIVAEISIPVEFSILVKPGTKLSDISRVATHPHAQAQCLDWLAKNLPGVHVLPAMSTAHAASELANGANYDAAICARVAADHYGLEILADNIGDNDAAWTRFVLVRTPGHAQPSTGNDKTTVSLFIHENHAGALQEILTEFTMHGIDLTRLESRPTKKQLGEYFFSLDFEGHIDDERVGEALKGLHRICADVLFLGSYPRHAGQTTELKAGSSNAEFIEADEWLANIRRRV
jgi:prephenate dehydratase